MTDISFSHGILKIAKIIMEKSSEPLYFYLFNYISELNYMSLLSESPIPTACHADDNGKRALIHTVGSTNDNIFFC